LIRFWKEDLTRKFEIKDMVLIITSSYWKYGKEMGNFLSLRESIPTRYFKGSACTSENPWRHL